MTATRNNIIFNPFTGEGATIPSWAVNYFGIHPNSLRYRLAHFTLEEVFGGKVRSNGEPTIINPATGEEHYADEWAIRLGYSPKWFKERFGKNHPNLFAPHVVEGSYPLALADSEREFVSRHNVLLCENPATGQKMPAKDWAAFYGVSLLEFYRAMKRYGRNNKELYRHFGNRRRTA